MDYGVGEPLLRGYVLWGIAENRLGERIMVRKLVWGIFLGGLFSAASLGQQTPDFTAPEAIAEAERRINLGEETNDPVPMQEGMELLRRVLETDPVNTEANLLFAETLIKAAELPELPPFFRQYGGLDTARDRFKAVLGLEPNNFRANFGYGKILLANRAWRQAASFLETALRVAGSTERESDVKSHLAFAQLNMGDFTLAIENAEDAVRMNPEDLDTRETLVQIHRTAAARDPRYLENALDSVTRYVAMARTQLEQQPWDRERLARLGGAYEYQIAILRDYHGSFYRRDARREVTSDLLPGKEAEAAAALNLMAEKIAEYALVKHTLDLHDAVLIAERAVELEPRNIEYLENLAGLYQRINNAQQAVELCQRILGLDPDHAEAQQFLKSQGVAPNPIAPPEASTAP
jgi:tetratricopeptide (TPR) repeat protein